MTHPPTAGRQGRRTNSVDHVMDAQDRRPADQEVVERMKSSDERTPADEQLHLLGEKLDGIITRPVDVSSFMDAQLGSDLKDLGDKLHNEMVKLSSVEEPERSSSPRWRRMQRLGERLERVHVALRSLSGLLDALREVEAENPTLLPDWRDHKSDSQRAIEQRIQTLVEQSEEADVRLRAAGMSLTLHSVDVDCCCLTMMSTQRLSDLTNDEDADQVFLPADVENFGEDPWLQEGPTQAGSLSSRAERSDDDDAAQRDVEEGTFMGEEEVEERAQRRNSLMTVLEEIRGCAEKLQLQEATLPALQQRQRVLTSLQNQLLDHLPERNAVSDPSLQESGTRALSDLWEETSRAVTDRLDQCSALTELVKTFQSVSTKLRAALLRAESRVGEQKSYMGKENLEKMHTQVDKTKAELVSLVATIGGLRSTCRKLHTHLRHIPGCSVDLYEEEADALMDQWLDICEKTDCHLEILHRVLTLWEGALQLGVELETRTSLKLSGFMCDSVVSPEESLQVLKRELQIQEDIMRAFHRRSTEIQVLLQSSEPLLELQVVETQMLKKMQQLREFVSAEDVCLQERTVHQGDELKSEVEERRQQEVREELRSDGAKLRQRLKEDSAATLDPDDSVTEEQEESSQLNSDLYWPESCCAPLMEEPNVSEDPEDRGDILETCAGKDDEHHWTQGCDSRLRTLVSGVPDVFGEPSTVARLDLLEQDQRLMVVGSKVDGNVLEVRLREPSSREDSALKPSTIRIVVTTEDLDSLPPAMEQYLSHTSKTDILKAIDEALEEDENLRFDTFVAAGESLHCSSSGTPEGFSSTLSSCDTPESVLDLSAAPAGHNNAPGSENSRALESRGSSDLRNLQTRDSQKNSDHRAETMQSVDAGNCHEGPEELWTTSSLHVTRCQHTEGDMDAERTQDSPGARSCSHQPTMQDVLSEIPAAVETSSILSRALELHSYPDESEVCLVRLVQKVLVCRYQPAQLDAAAMARQLQEAEELKSCVEQQVALMKSGAVELPVDMVEELLAAALLDASATVQVKAAQLDHVKHFHRQLRMIKAFLEVISEEHQASLASSESDATQADKLQVLRHTMESKTEMMEKLRHLSGHLSIHLSGSESSGALFAQIGDVQEEWRCLEESVKRDLHQTLNSVIHASRLVSEAKLLQDKLETTQKSIVSFAEPRDVRSCLDLAVTAGDLKLYQRQHLHLQCQAEALVRFSLGPEQKDDVEQLLQELSSTLSNTTCNLDSVRPSSQVSKQLQDLIRWVKHAELQIWTGESLSLFPEEARFHITQMKKLQTEILSRRSKIKVELKDLDMSDEDFEKVLEHVTNMFDEITKSVDLVLGSMKRNLQVREKLLCQLANLDVWLAEAHARRQSHADLENISKQPTVELKRMLKTHTLAVSEIQTKLSLVEELEDGSRECAADLSLEESRYLVNRLSGLWVELDRIVGYEEATIWEVGELIHEKTTSDKELAALEESLKEISARLAQQKFPVTAETRLTIARLKHQLMEHQCQVQEIRHDHEGKRSFLLCVVGELQDRCKALSVHAFEQEKYLHLRGRMETARESTREQMKRSREKQHSIGERLRLCQTLLVELPLVKTLCQEAADQLEAISQELDPLDLNSERQRIQRTVDTLVIREVSVTDHIKTLEANLLQGLRFSSELSSLTEFFRKTRRELRESDPLCPDEKAVDAALRWCWTLWRNMDSGMRVFEALRRKQKFKRSDFGELYSLREAAVQECQGRMENLSQVRESLKDYQWAARGAIGFLRNAETTFLSAHGGFLDCAEEQVETQKALEVLEEGFRSHMCHLDELVPTHPCLSGEATRQLHIGVLSQLVVGRAVLEAQAQLRLESLQRCKVHQENHKICHEEMKRSLSGFEVKLSECSGEHVMTFDEAAAQHGRVQVLKEDLSNLAGKMEDLRAGCPMLGCGVGKDGGLGVVWRRWVLLRHHISLLMARTEQRREEWKDVQKGMEQSCSSLSGLQTLLPDSSTARFEKPQRLLDEAERRQARLEHEQRAAASLQHRLEHTLCLSSPHDPGPARQTLEQLQEDIRSMKVKNMLVVAAAEAEQKEQRQIEEKLAEVERRIRSQDSWTAQKVREERAGLKRIMDSVRSRYHQPPSDINQLTLALEQSLQRAEDEVTMRSGPVQKLVSRVEDLGSGLDKVKKLLELKGSSVTEAQKALKHVWDELDTWHNRLTLLESDVQDLVEDQPDQAHLFMDQLTQPLQLYQNVSKMAEQRTNFLSKIPARLQQFEDLQHNATCWLEEAQSWISAASSFTTSRSLQNYANALQLVLDDSERIRAALQDFRPVLAEVSLVCDITDQETRLDRNDQRVQTMQRNILEPLELLQLAAELVEAMEAELKTLERNVPKIQAILQSVENPSIPPREHHNNRQVILANLQSMRRTLEDMQSCRGELHLPPRLHESLQVFSRVEVLLQTLRELEQLTQDQVALLENKMVEETREASSCRSLEALVETISEEDDEDDSCSLSSSDTLTCSLPEDPEETCCAVSEDEAAMKTSVQESKEAAGGLESVDAAEVKKSDEEAAQAPQFGSEAATSSPVTPKHDTDESEHQPEETRSTLYTEDSVDDGSGMNQPGDEENDGATSEPHASDSCILSEQEVDQSGPETTGLLPELDSSAAPGPDTEAVEDQGEDDVSAFTGDEPEGLLEEPMSSDLQQLSSTSEHTCGQASARGPAGDHNLTDCDVPHAEQWAGDDQGRLYNWLCGLSDLDTSESLTEALSLQCEVDSGEQEGPEEKTLLLEASRSLLQGMVHLLDLGEDRAAGQQKTQSYCRGQLPAELCRHKKLQKLLGSQLAFVQHLVQREPEVLQGQEEALDQVKVRVRALQEQEVASERTLQDWTRWEDDCRRLNHILDELEVVVSAEDPESEDEEEAARRHKLQSCQQALLQLEESRAALGLILDRRERLQALPSFGCSVRQAGGALELRWRSLHRRMKQEIQRCRDIQDCQSRFHSHFGSASEGLLHARKHLETLKLTSDLDHKDVCRNLVLLLDLSSEVENTSVHKASASRVAARLLALRDADCPSLRRQRDQLEGDWSQLTSDLSTTQEQLQQRLLLCWPPLELLSHLQLWIQKSKDRLTEESESALAAEDAAQIKTSLQKHQDLRAGLVSGQLLLDFLTQSGPQVVGEDVQSLRCTRTTFAERVGDVRLMWLTQQRDVARQICRLEQIHHTCAGRERQLQRLQTSLDEQNKLLRKRPDCRSRARRVLQNWEVEVGGLEEACAELQQLKSSTCVSEEKLRCDEVFSGRADALSGSCDRLMQQTEHLKTSLRQTTDDWEQFHKSLCEVSLQTTRLRCSLQHQTEAPLMSLPQTEELMESLQALEESNSDAEGLWTLTLRAFQNLPDTLDRTSAQILSSDLEEERSRWSEVQQQLKVVLGRTRETLSLWREHNHLSDICCNHLKQLRNQWRALSAEQNTEEKIHSLEVPTHELQVSLEPALESSRSLTERLDPLGADLIQSESRLWSRDASQLIRRASNRQSLLEEQQLFHSQLDQFGLELEKILHEHNTNDEDTTKQRLLQLSGLVPSLLRLQESIQSPTASERSTETLQGLGARWSRSVTRTCDAFRELQTTSLSSLDFLHKCRALTSTTERIHHMVSSTSDSDIQDLVAEHQALGLELMTGDLLLRLLLRQAAELQESQTEAERSLLLTLKEKWTRSEALALQQQESTTDQLTQWRRFRLASRWIWKLLRDVDSVLPPDGAEQMTLQQLLTGVDQYRGAADALARHSGALTLVRQAGRRVCESELKNVEEALGRTCQRLEQRRGATRSAAQKWSQFQKAVTNIRSELDELQNRWSETSQESEEETLIQDSEVSLHLLSCGLRDAGAMKADLTGYMLTGDSTLLEQQLEQLHGQWEELCQKVSSRRQEIADRLSAWTIFNDKNKELCDWLTQMENKSCERGDLSVEEMVEKLKKDCMEEINLFSENKSHLKQLGEQLLTASDEAKQSQVHGSLQEVHQRWHNLFLHIEARVKKLKETLSTVQQLDKNMSNLRAWLTRVEADLSRPVTYSVCHHQEIQRRLAEQQELQRDIEQHTEGVASVLSLCDVLLRDEDAAVSGETESDSLQETSRSLDQRWRTICALAVDRRLRIEETWRLWCKFLDDYSRFEDWLKMAELTAANPNSSDVPYSAAREELKKFEGFQRQVHERLTQLELVNNLYRRLARENRTDRASQIRAMVNDGNQRWDTLHRRVAAVLRRLKHFTGQREDFESTRESMLVWLTELDLQLTNVEHFSESDVHHKIQQLSSFQKEITLNTERIDGLIVFGEGLIQKSSPQDAALMEEELEELHSYCQEVFGRLVRFHQRLSQPPITEEPETSGFSLESSLELIGRPWLGRSLGSLPTTPSHLLTSPLSRSGRETPVSVDSLPLEWDHTGDVGGSSSHEDEEDEEGLDDEGSYFSTLSAPRWRPAGDPDPEAAQDDVPVEAEAPPTLTSTPLKPTYLSLATRCGGSVEELERVSLMLDDQDQPEEPGLTGLRASEQQSGVIERWELIQAQSRNQQHSGLSDVDDVTSWLEDVVPKLERHLQADPADMDELSAAARDLKETQREFAHAKSLVLSLNLRAPGEPGQQERLVLVNRAWNRVGTGLQQWDASLRTRLLRCQDFHQSLHSLLLWLAHAESRRYAVDVRAPETPLRALRRHRRTLTDLQGELEERRVQQEALQALWSQLRPEDTADDSEESQEKIHVTGSKLASLLVQVQDDLELLRRRLDAAPDDSKSSGEQRRERSDAAPARSFFGRVLRAALPLHVLLLLLLLLPCLLPLGFGESGCADVNNFARSFHPMLRYTNGPPPT